MSSFNGIGEKLYGHKDVDPDGSYVATKWLIVFFLPIAPIKSYRVYSEESKISGVPFIWGSFDKKYQLRPIELDKKQVARTYLFVYGSILILILLNLLFDS